MNILSFKVPVGKVIRSVKHKGFFNTGSSGIVANGKFKVTIHLHIDDRMYHLEMNRNEMQSLSDTLNNWLKQDEGVKQ